MRSRSGTSWGPIACLFALALLGAAPSDAEPVRIQPPGVAEGAYRGQCRTLNRQIDRYVEQAGLALKAGNDTWADANFRRISHLNERRARLCPKYVDDRSAEELLQLLRLGGRVALKMYTMGIL